MSNENAGCPKGLYHEVWKGVILNETNNCLLPDEKKTYFLFRLNFQKGP